jgi:Tol biopolymer transport system component
MPLPAGTRLGPYEIVAPIGAGGMGEVYRARDTRLGRDVALKVSAAQFTERFEREARTIATLNHPNICTLYDVGPNYLVMELIDGATLAERIKDGPVPLSDALAIARQIKDALDAAHEKGIVHRDLKPANIKITHEGVVKVLDFGLALVAPASSRESDPINSPTLTMHATQAGVILGTAAYMSPEQARGKVVDKRADIWAFGVVLHEMVTGTRLFQGEDLTETLASVVKDKPDLSGVPPQVRRLLERCLEKDPKKRLRDIGDAWELLDAEAEVGQAISSPAAGSRTWLWPVVAGVATLALIVAAALLYNATRPAPLRPLIRTNINLEDNMPLAKGANNGSMLAVSPDGMRLAVTVRGADGKLRLYTRLLNQSQSTLLAGTDNATDPFFSPDNEWIGFFADDKLKKISVDGGAAVTLCDAPSDRGASWGDDGNIIAALDAKNSLVRVPSTGGTPEPVTKLNPGEITHRWPQVLPGSRAVLFTAATHAGGYDDANIDVVSFKTGERKTVGRGGFYPRYLATSTGSDGAFSNGTGHLVYLHQAVLFAVPFDLGRLAPTGSPAPILDDVSSSSTSGVGQFAFAGSPNGSPSVPGIFVYLAGNGTARGWSISWVDSSGKTQPLHGPLGRYLMPRFSPDGKRLAFSIGSAQGGDDIWVKDLDRDTPSRLSFLPGQNRWPVWTPDGKNIVFASTNPAGPGLYWIRSDGSGEAQRLTDGKLGEVPYSFSPDGKRLAFHQTGNGASLDIFTAPVERDPARGPSAVRLGKPELFLGTPFIEAYPAFSPDGRWLAYGSNESGTPEVYVRPFPGPGGRWQISTGGGVFPHWSHVGRELLFQTLDGRVMAVGYTAKGDSFAAGKPQLWTQARLRETLNTLVSNYDLAPDGKRLAAMLADDASGDRSLTRLTFLLNFFDELRRRSPAR